MVERVGELRHFVLRLADRQPLVHLLSFYRLRRRRHVPYRLEYSTAHQIARDQREDQSDERYRRQDQQHVSKELLLERDRLEEMQIENLSAALQRQPLVVRHRLVRLDQLKLAARPERRVPTYVRHHLLDRRELRIVFDDRPALDVRHSQHYALRHRVARPETAVKLIAATEFLHRMTDRTLHRQLRLMIK